MTEEQSSSPFRVEQTPEGRRFSFDVRAQAERMCFMMDAIREPHEVRTRVTINGTAVA